MIYVQYAEVHGEIIITPLRRWRRIVRVEQRAILAVWSSVGPWSPCDLLLVMFCVNSCVETAKFGARVIDSGWAGAGIDLPYSLGFRSNIFPAIR